MRASCCAAGTRSASPSSCSSSRRRAEGAASHFFILAGNGRNSPSLVWLHRGDPAAWTRSRTMEQDKQETGIANETAATGRTRTRWIVAGSVAVLAIAGIGAAGAMGAADGMGRQFMEVGMKHGGHFAGRGL